MQDTNKKGCVYFFRHIGLSPIKIGYSNSESPLDRFNQFRTYAPYGSEIIGFIQTDEAKEIETKLHLKYLSKRLSGEWFEITEEEVIKEIDFYSNIEDIKDRNEFQIAWAKELYNRKNGIKELVEKSKVELNKKELFFKMYNSDKNLNKKHTAQSLGVSRRCIYHWLNPEKYK